MADRLRGDWDCVGVARETYAEKQKQQQQSQKPQPWIVRKLVVGVVLAIVVWTYYVYIGRMCVKLLNRGDTVKGGVYIAIFNVFFLMFSWTYLKALITPPGYARDHVPQCDAPAFTQYGRPWDVDSEARGTDDGHRTIGTAFEEMSERGHGQPTSTGSVSHEPAPARTPDDVEAGAVAELDAVPGAASLHAQLASVWARHEPPGGDHPTGDASTTLHGSQPRPQATAQNEPAAGMEKGSKRGKKPVYIERTPPQIPVLAEEYRYCARDKLLKPMRTHHCRLCATCVLQYDHHCPWIGQCVGAYNRKFFVNFTFWSTWFTGWVFGTQLADLVVDSNGGTAEMDGQEIAVTVLAGLFTMFTASLTVGHIRLLILNATTVESLGFARARDRDKANLEQAFSIWQCREKYQTRKRWDQEWGRIEREGNLWWLENARTNWEQVMGHSVWEWLFPIGKSPNDGMHFPVNPRHDVDGRWRPRSQWPVELQ